MTTRLQYAGRLVSAVAAAVLGTSVGLSVMTLLTSCVNPVTLPKSVGQSLVLVSVALACVSAAAGVVAALGLKHFTTLMFRPVGPTPAPTATGDRDYTLRLGLWRKTVAGYGLLAGSVLLVVLVPGLVSQVERFGPLVTAFVVLPAVIAAAKPPRPFAGIAPVGSTPNVVANGTT